MAALALPSLEVQRFRGFQDLRIEKLGRINLIVGKNNIGKSNLLEAIQLYARRAHPAFLRRILATHDEDRGSQQIEDALSAAKYLFFGRKDITGSTDPIKIGPIDNPEQQLQISIDFYISKVDEGGRTTWQILAPEEYNTAKNPIPRFSISLGSFFNTSFALDAQECTRSLDTAAQETNVVSVDVNGLEKQRIAQLWDKVTLTNYEQYILQALQIAAPGTEAINTVSNAQSTSGERTPIIKVQGIPEPLPFRTLGDGMQRILDIALALVSAQNGILIIDEIENGLYYSVQEDLWELIFQVACQLNVQVFATTHSWDCISAFQGAIQDEKNEEGLLIRLGYKKDNIVSTIFDERKLTIATREHIEVR